MNAAQQIPGWILQDEQRAFTMRHQSKWQRRPVFIQRVAERILALQRGLSRQFCLAASRHEHGHPTVGDGALEARCGRAQVMKIA
ncbi:hypothetical protein QTI27_17695 [Variovorax sp. J31P216]|nr:hypothetical protein [Variovorax sp. J31P216]